MLSDHFRADPHATPRPHWRLWAFFAALAVTGPVVHNWQEHRESRLQAEHQKLMEAGEARIDKFFAPVHARKQRDHKALDVIGEWSIRQICEVFRRMGGTVAVVGNLMAGPSQPTRREVEHHLNDGRPFETTPLVRKFSLWVASGDVPCEMALWQPSDGGAPLRLYFAADELVLVEEADLPPFQPPWGAESCRSIRTQWMRWGPWLWGLLVLLPLVLRRHRVWLAELSTGAALLILVAASPRSLPLPGTVAWASFLQNANVAWAMFELSTSAAVLIWAFLRQSNVSLITCSLCGYNLRGNRTGICPECGTGVPAVLRERLARI